MLIPPSQLRLPRTIDRAIQNQDPERYQRLQQNQELTTFLATRAEEMREAYWEAENDLLNQLDHFQRTQPETGAAAWLQTGSLALWNQILANFLEF